MARFSYIILYIIWFMISEETIMRRAFLRGARVTKSQQTTYKIVHQNF